jgi:hypothetical protein
MTACGGRGRVEPIWGGYGEDRMKAKAPQNSVNAKCSTCEGQFRTRRRVRTEKSYCSSRCRLLYWAAHVLLEAYREGRADGLRETIRKLGEVRR